MTLSNDGVILLAMGVTHALFWAVGFYLVMQQKRLDAAIAKHEAEMGEPRT